MLWSWYLADDTQFYVLGCFLLILAVRSVLDSYITSSVCLGMGMYRTLAEIQVYWDAKLCHCGYSS